MRSRAKSKFKFLVTGIVALIIITVGFIMYQEGTLPTDKQNPESKIFIITPGESLTSIINKLEKEGFIRNKIVFFAIVKQLGIEKQIQAGDFRLSTGMDAYEIARKLTQGTLDEWVTVIEGLRREEIAEIMTEKMGVSELEFLEATKDLEGQLFPDTYLIPRKATVNTIVSLLTNTFGTRYSSDIAAKANRLGLTRAQVLTMASIVEKEAKVNDRDIVASILMRRYKEEHLLQADATVQYALGYDRQHKTWWTPAVYLEDLKNTSPYNTYRTIGLPPGPICNPGVSSIEAVVNANPDTPYFYYMHDSEGKIHPARNLEKHERNIDRYGS